MHTGKRLNFYAEIKEGLSVFDSLDYSVITGGFVQNAGKLSDVDIITVIPCVSPGSRDEAMSFVKTHVDAQKRSGFVPDYMFPSDILSRQQIVDAVNGRALAMDGKNLKLKKYTKEEFNNNPEADYRVWLYEMITHDFDMIRGNFDLLVNDTLIALKTVWLYAAALFGYRDSVSIEQVRHDLFSSAGLDYCLNEKQCRHLLVMLKKHGMGTINGAGLLILDDAALDRETENLKKAIAGGFRATHFLEWNTIRESVI